MFLGIKEEQTFLDPFFSLAIIHMLVERLDELCQYRRRRFDISLNRLVSL